MLMQPGVALRPSLAIIRCLLIHLFSWDFLILSSPLLTEAGTHTHTTLNTHLCNCTHARVSAKCPGINVNEKFSVCTHTHTQFLLSTGQSRCLLSMWTSVKRPACHIFIFNYSSYSNSWSWKVHAYTVKYLTQSMKGFLRDTLHFIMTLSVASITCRQVIWFRVNCATSVMSQRFYYILPVSTIL